MLAVSAAPRANAAEPSVPAATFAGQTLQQALLTLTDLGLELVFTDRVVRPDMRVTVEPTVGDPRLILDELLRPHGLAARLGAGGVLLVVPASAAESVVEGRVRERTSGRVLPGVTVEIVEGDHETTTDGEGRFRLPGVVAGRYFLQASQPGYVVLQSEIQVTPEAVTALAIELQPIPLTIEEIDVRARTSGLFAGEISTLNFERAQLLAMPSVGDDVLRPLTMLPGTTGNDLSAKFHIRGGRADEVMVTLDGFEILEPYHLKDFDSALSILAPDTIGSARLLTGGFPAQYGDRMGGVLELTTREPDWRQRTELGLSVLHAVAAHSGTLPEERGHWLGAFRLGSFELASTVGNEPRDPRFSDLFGKVDFTLAPNKSLRANLLVSEDELDFTEQTGELEVSDDGDDEEEIDLIQFQTSYVNAYVWLSHLHVLQRGLTIESRASYSRIERDRRGDTLAEAIEFALRDRRFLRGAAVAQDWAAKAAERHDLKWGFELRRLDVDYDYIHDRDLADPLAAIRDQPREGTTRFDQRFEGEQIAVYFTDRIRPSARVTADVGVRFDENTILDDEHISPRFSLSYQASSRSRWLLAWGYFYQSQRVYELQVEDGVTQFFPAERAEHRIVGYEHVFEPEAASKRRPITMRAEIYDHHISDPRPRFENLFDPISLAPEIEADRVRVVPSSSRSSGLELSLSGSLGDRVDWLASVSRARIEDQIDQLTVPRNIDQPFALKLDLRYRAPWQWQLNLAFELRRGWPTTAIAARNQVGPDDASEVTPVLGPLYGERLSDYRRVDLRGSRRFEIRRGELELFFDIQNLTDARNVRGFDVNFETTDSGEVQVEKKDKHWSPIAPSFGVRWVF